MNVNRSNFMKERSGSCFLLPLVMLWWGLLFVSCEKDTILEDPSAKLTFSADTVLFDTIFSNIGSATRHFKVYNPHRKSVEISSISLSGGVNSAFRINVDGIPGRDFNNIVVRGGDSLFVFVETTIDPLDVNSPVIVEDSVVFLTNGNLQDVKLIAWGQDVIILNAEVFQSGTLTAEKPYLVYNSMTVDSGHILNIEPGVRIHFHHDSRLYVSGSIVVTGTYEQPVIFEGARTETVYRNIPGQWGGILLMPGSEGSRFINARIRNAVTGIQIDSAGFDESLVLYLANTRIENMTFAGIYARGAKIYSYNTIISNCGHFAIALTNGGDYSFYHCTVANYWSFSNRHTPSIFIDNTKPITAIFGNSIIHGSQSQEINLSVHPGIDFDILFNHCLVSSGNFSNPGMFRNCIYNTLPGFVDLSEFNFRLGEDSPAIDTADPEIGNLFPFDYEGNSRSSGNAPDMGAYERLIE
jgi:hypothetical protein